MSVRRGGRSSSDGRIKNGRKKHCDRRGDVCWGAKKKEKKPRSLSSLSTSFNSEWCFLEQQHVGRLAVEHGVCQVVVDEAPHRV